MTTPVSPTTLAAMVGLLSRRLLAIVQFTRSALVFTAIGDAWSSLMLRAGGGPDLLNRLEPKMFLGATMLSVGLYGFGMSLNDVVDHRRDALLAADRPLPSGRLPIRAARWICVLLLALAGIGGAILYSVQPTERLESATVALILGVVGLIVCYDFAGKYLTSLGLLTLGLIRLFHIAAYDPTLAVPWHGLLIFNHIAIVSSIAYAWEHKRPPLSKRHVAIVGAGLVVINGSLIGSLYLRRGGLAGLAWSEELIWPAVALCGFVIVASTIRQRNADSRGAGKMLMLAGLLWLIVYDASFVFAYVGPAPAGVIVALLPVAWLSVKLIRGWAAVVALSEQPGYLRA